jgi:hypothetical protein
MLRVFAITTLVLSIGLTEAHAKRIGSFKPPPTAEQILARKTQVFKNLDKNHDGRLTQAEYLVDKKPDVKEQIEKVFTAADKDGKGLTLAQFLASYDALQAAAAGHNFDYLKTRPFFNIKTESLTVAWQYSNDGGKTFGNKPLAAPMYGDRQSYHPYAWKGTFDVPDPAKIAGLWVRLVDDSKHYAAPRASMCNGDLVAASGGYWKDLGFCPCLLDAVVVFNGQEIKLGNGPVLHFWVPLEGQLRQGQNTIELRGNVYSYWGGGGFDEQPVKSIDARIVAAEAQPTEIYNGPVLGDFGDDYFTLACRTQLPADLIVEATPIEPPGAAVTTISPHSIWHRVKAEIPKGTRKFRYTLTARVGQFETSRGPWEVSLPGKEFRFVAFGNISATSISIDIWGANARGIVADAKPNMLIVTGNEMENGPWEWLWDEYYLQPGGELFATTPTLVTPCCRDFTGMFNGLHYTPAPDTSAHDWSKVVGQVRFIGLDGNETWKKGEPNYRWLEGELKNAKEKFVVVLDGYPGYSSGVNSARRNNSLNQTRDAVLPLLGKYKATLMLCSWDPDYERCEPTPDKGVTQIVTGAIGKECMHRWSGVIAVNPFGPGPDAAPRSSGGTVERKGREWCGWPASRHYCIFDVKDGAMEMRVHPAASGCWLPHDLDQKTFKPR